jgi:hypothetical protein
MSSKTTMLIATAVALAAFATAPSASFAAAKKSEASQRSDFSDPTKCLGGGCTVSNPDRLVHYDTSFYKKSKRKPFAASTTNN